MGWLITKYLITAGVVVAVSEIAKRSDKLGGFVAALPLITFLALIWLYVEKQPLEKYPIMLGTHFGMSSQHYQCFSRFPIFFRA